MCFLFFFILVTWFKVTNKVNQRKHKGHYYCWINTFDLGAAINQMPLTKSDKLFEMTPSGLCKGTPAGRSSRPGMRNILGPTYLAEIAWKATFNLKEILDNDMCCTAQSWYQIVQHKNQPTTNCTSHSMEFYILDVVSHLERWLTLPSQQCLH